MIQNNGWAVTDEIRNTSDNGKRRASEWGRSLFNSRTYTADMPLRMPLDEIEPRQVDVRKWLAFYLPFELSICQSQLENFQPVLHLEISTSKKKKRPHTGKRQFSTQAKGNNK
jgi:hypothetical protein